MGLSRHVVVFLIVASAIIGYLMLVEMGKARLSPPASVPTVPARR